jgi:uncharacterized heparinase superfamily protein
MEAGRTVLIADTGHAPPLDSASAAHAGCLSFELASGGLPIVVNVGSPLAPGPARTAARRTAAHSTLDLGGVSSALLLDEAPGEIARFVEDRLGPVLVGGPAEIRTERNIDPDGWNVCTARHDGYERRFGVTHERRWSLAPGGARLDGTDRLLGTGRHRERIPAPILRFHLHPSVRATRDEATNAVELAVGTSGEVWRFRSEGPPAAVEESIYFGGPQGRRPTTQIVVRLEPPPADAPATTRWTFERVLEGARPSTPQDTAPVEEQSATGAEMSAPPPDQS